MFSTRLTKRGSIFITVARNTYYNSIQYKRLLVLSNRSSAGVSVNMAFADNYNCGMITKCMDFSHKSAAEAVMIHQSSKQSTRT